MLEQRATTAPMTIGMYIIHTRAFSARGTRAVVPNTNRFGHPTYCRCNRLPRPSSRQGSSRYCPSLSASGGAADVAADGGGGETRLRPPRVRFLSLGSMILRKERGRNRNSTRKKAKKRWES